MSYTDHRSRDYDTTSRGDRHGRNNSSSNNNNSYHHQQGKSSSSAYQQAQPPPQAGSGLSEDRDKYAGDYVSICLKNLNESMSDSELSSAINREFRKFGNFNVKVVYDRNMTRDRRAERIAFINFDSHEQAKEAKRTKLNIDFHGLQLYIEPVFRNRNHQPPPVSSSSSSSHKDRHYNNSNDYRAAPKSANRISTPPLPSSRRRPSRSLTPASSVHSSLSRSPLPSDHRRKAKRRSFSNNNNNNGRASQTTASRQNIRSPPPRTTTTKRRSYSRGSLSPTRSNTAAHKSRKPSARQSPSSHTRRPYYNSNQRDTYTSPSSYRHSGGGGSGAYQQRHQHHQHHYQPRHDHNPDFVYKPELNDKDVTRTLFIGNLDPDVHENELKKLFDRFGYIEEIDIKRIPNKKPYAFIKYINLDMARNAKMEMNDKLIGKFEIKIGFGKLQPTNCLWIGGLKNHTKKTSLEKCFGHYGKIREIDWNPGDLYAYILYDNTEDAEAARNNLNEKPLPNGYSEQLRIDYADPKRFESNIASGSERSRSRTRTRSKTESNNNSVSRSRTRSKSAASRSRSRSKSAAVVVAETMSSPGNVAGKRNNDDNGHQSSGDEGSYKKQKVSTSVARKIRSPRIDDEREADAAANDEDKMDTLDTSSFLIKDQLVNNREVALNRIRSFHDLGQDMPHTWSGTFLLKKLAFPTKFYMLAGNKRLIDDLLPANTTSAANASVHNLPSLRITQRLRLNRIGETEKKLYDASFTLPSGQSVDTCQFSVLISLPYEIEGSKSETTGAPMGDLESSSSSGALQQRDLHHLITYLNQKTSAGIIPVPDDDRRSATVHAFPPNCEFAAKLLKQLLPSVKMTAQQTTDCLLIVLLKNN